MLLNTRTYTVNRTLPDQLTYVGVGATFSSVDKLDVSRSYPKPVPNFAGVAKPTAKLTRTVVINATTGETANAIFSVSASLPVGMSDTDVDGGLADVAAFAASAECAALFKKLDLNY